MEYAALRVRRSGPALADSAPEYGGLGGGRRPAALEGTELPLLVRQSDVEVPLLDTTRLHMARALEIMLDRP
ncbi:MAG TPA: hypothetical protein VFM14_16235 [Gemmatimonadales bacterium]|nr:hypothetical protein [Gemmatimonadales bacterium]